jgi:hypothetical protein
VPLDPGLVHEVHGPQLQAAQGDLGAFLRLRREEEHRRRAVGHDAPQGLQAVHARHLDVERHHVRPEVEGLLPSVLAVHGRGHDLDVGRVAQHAREGLAHEGGVVDDQDADHFPAACA